MEDCYYSNKYKVEMVAEVLLTVVVMVAAALLKVVVVSYNNKIVVATDGRLGAAVMVMTLTSMMVEAGHI